MRLSRKLHDDLHNGLHNDLQTASFCEHFSLTSVKQLFTLSLLTTHQVNKMIHDITAVVLFAACIVTACFL